MARKRLPSDVGFQANQAEAAYVALWPKFAASASEAVTVSSRTGSAGGGELPIR